MVTAALLSNYLQLKDLLHLMLNLNQPHWRFTSMYDGYDFGFAAPVVRALQTICSQSFLCDSTASDIHTASLSLFFAGGLDQMTLEGPFQLKRHNSVI